MQASYEQQVCDRCAEFSLDPEGFVDWAFDWGFGELEQHKGQRDWQRKLNQILAKELQRKQKRKNRVIRIAVASGHDIGKSAETAFVQHWGMSSKVDTKIRVTANTGNQLKVTTWSELAKWHRLCITNNWFTCTATSFYSNQQDHSLNWRSDAAVWREGKTEAFAGLHNAKKRLIIILDESSGIPIPIWEVVEGACMGEDTEIIVLAFGNPTRNSGYFFDIFNNAKMKKITADDYLKSQNIEARDFDWITMQIDSRTVEGTNKEEIQSMLERHGEDSDFFRTRVRGLFPRASSMQFIPTDWVGEAMRRHGRSITGDPLIMGIDFSRGGEDSSVIFFRRGKDAQTIAPIIIPGEEVHDSTRLSARIIEACNRYKPDYIFGDATGIGGPIMDFIEKSGYRVFQVNFGSTKTPDPHYYDMTAYMGGQAKEWIYRGGALWENPDFEAQLTQREFDHTTSDELYLESKKELKKRGLQSPDIADAFFLTFAQKVAPTTGLPAARRHEMKTTLNGYNPLDGDGHSRR